MDIPSHTATLFKYYLSFLNYDLAKIYLEVPHPAVRSPMEHLDAAARWICRAQDAFDDGGVARSYSIIYDPYFQRKGWQPSYPETTGYIIPTIYDYAKWSRREEMHNRAVRMADWECEVQMPSGAVQGGMIGQPRTPAIFNTGQVIFGWVRAYRETGHEKYLSSAIKAGKFLVDSQEEDGSWRKNLSDYASKKIDSYTYNTRTAWALMCLHSETDDMRYRTGSIRNIEHSLRQQTESGWFRNNCLWDPSRPVVHTIAYCIRGILEVGASIGSPRYIEAARKAADALLANQRRDGSLAGKFDEQWKSTVRWSCLTGIAQMAIIWGRLYQMTGDGKYLAGMKGANRYLMRVQLYRTTNPDLFGGICGSYPIHGQYGRYEVLNWAVKFFMDALMLEMKIENQGRDS